jgi:dTDP-glucose 4,6-dehydratase
LRVLITGGLGFIGSHLASMAAARGHHVRVLDCLTYAGRRDNLPMDWKDVHDVDVGDRELVAHHLRGFRPHWILHAAAETHVGRAVEDHEVFLRTNVVGTGVLLEESRKYWELNGRPEGFSFVHVSTDEVYGSLAAGDPPWDEHAPLRPRNPYAASKAAADVLCLSYHATYGFPAVVTRGSNTYGPRQHPEKLVPKLIRQAASGEFLTLHGDGLNVRDWLHVEDHCSGILAAADAGRNGQCYNLGGEQERTNYQVAMGVLQAFGLSRNSIAFVGDRPGNDRRYALDSSKAEYELAWRPGVGSFERDLAYLCGWYRESLAWERSHAAA